MYIVISLVSILFFHTLQATEDLSLINTGRTQETQTDPIMSESQKELRVSNQIALDIITPLPNQPELTPKPWVIFTQNAEKTLNPENKSIVELTKELETQLQKAQEEGNAQEVDRLLHNIKMLNKQRFEKNLKSAEIGIIALMGMIMLTIYTSASMIISELK